MYIMSNIQGLVRETLSYAFSTRASSGINLNAISDYKSKVYYDIPDLVIHDAEYVYFSIPYIVIPNSFYIINETNCVLNVIENAVSISYSFPYGNYTLNSFLAKFSSILGSRWIITADNITSLLTISNTTYSFQILSTSTIGQIMGFSGNVNSNLVSSKYVAILPRPFSFFPLPRICMKCPEIASACILGANGCNSGIVLTIPNSGVINGKTIYQSSVSYRLDRNVNNLTISFTDDDNNYINFNGVSTYFTIQFDIYKTPTEKQQSYKDALLSINQKTLTDN